MVAVRSCLMAIGKTHLASVYETWVLLGGLGGRWMVLHDCWGYAASLQAIWVLKAIKAICMFLRGWVWGCGVVMLDCRAYLTSGWI